LIYSWDAVYLRLFKFLV